MGKRYAISDIHGNCTTFRRLLDAIQLAPNDDLYLLGDYVDRGPDSRGVIQLIHDLRTKGYRIHCLLGNHEQFMLEATAKGVSKTDRKWWFWMQCGGRTTYASYLTKGKEYADLLAAHREWMTTLPYYLDLGDYLLVHAGFNFGYADPFEDTHAMLFKRNWYDTIDRHWLGERTIVHGHTPRPRSEIITQTEPDFPYPVVDIDAGCFHDRPGYGHLAAFDLDDRQFTFLPNADMRLKAISTQQSPGAS